MIISAVQKTTLVDFPGKVACIAFTPGCNFRCPFCHNPEVVLPEEIKKIQHEFIPEEYFFNFLNQRKGVLDGVVVCGGEPTLQADLYEFTKKIKDLGFLVKLDTNGRDAKSLKKLLDEDLLDYVAIDIKNPISKYSELTGVKLGKDFFENYDECLSLLKNGNIDYEYRTTVIKGHHSLENIEEMAKYLEGTKNYYLQNFRPDHTLDPNFEGESFNQAQLEEMKKVAEKYVGKCGIRS